MAEVSSAERPRVKAPPRKKRRTTLKNSKTSDAGGNAMLPFTFDLPPAALVLVNCEEKLQPLHDALLNCELLAIDTETQPSFVPMTVRPPYPTALLQLATRSSSGVEEVFIVDLLSLSGQVDEEQLSDNGKKKNKKQYAREQAQQAARREQQRGCRLLNLLDTILLAVMSDARRLKIGQGLIGDFKELRKNYPYMKAFHWVDGVLEVNALLKELRPETINMVSLKSLVRDFLHLDLLKGQQMSNWGRRPLSEAQIQYAACDALVLLRLYDTMSSDVCDLKKQERSQQSTSKKRKRATGASGEAVFDVCTLAVKFAVSTEPSKRERKMLKLDSKQREKEGE